MVQIEICLLPLSDTAIISMVKDCVYSQLYRYLILRKLFYKLQLSEVWTSSARTEVSVNEALL